MPIIGLTDQGARFPQIGTLRKGAEKVDERRPGKDLTYFRFDTDDAEALAAFVSAYGAEPRAVNVYLPYPTTDENLSAWQEHWVAGGLKRRCDGRTCVLRQVNGKYDSTPHPCVCTSLPADSKERCKPVGRLQVIIPELRRLAYVMALTTSIHDIKNLSQQLTALELSNGTLRGVPLVLRRSPVEISMPSNDGKRVRREKWLLSIEAAPRWVGLQLESMERSALSGFGVAAPALPAPSYQAPRLAAPVDVYEDEAEVEVIEAEPVAPQVEPARPQPSDAQTVDGAIEAVTRKANAEGTSFTSFKIGPVQLIGKTEAVDGLAEIEDGDLATVIYRPEKAKRTGIVSYVVQSLVWERPHFDDQGSPGALFEPVEDVNALVPDEEPA